MTHAMVKGSNIQLDTASVRAVLRWSPGGEPPDVDAPDVDASALLLGEPGQVRTDADFVFYNQPQHPAEPVRHVAKAQDGEQISDTVEAELSALGSDVDRVVLAASADGGTFSGVAGLHLLLYGLSQDGTAQEPPLVRFDITPETGSESALLCGELYRRGDGWKFRALGQGYEDGLVELATHFGVSVEEDESSLDGTERTDGTDAGTAVDARGGEGGGAVRTGAAPAQETVPAQGGAPDRNAVPGQDAVPDQDAVPARAGLPDRDTVAAQAGAAAEGDTPWPGPAQTPGHDPDATVAAGTVPQPPPEPDFPPPDPVPEPRPEPAPVPNPPPEPPPGPPPGPPGPGPDPGPDPGPNPQPEPPSPEPQPRPQPETQAAAAAWTVPGSHGAPPTVGGPPSTPPVYDSHGPTQAVPVGGAQGGAAQPGGAPGYGYPQPPQHPPSTQPAYGYPQPAYGYPQPDPNFTLPPQGPQFVNR